MPFKHFIAIVCIGLACLGCKENMSKTDNHTLKEKDSNAFFKADGEGWSIQISEKAIRFTADSMGYTSFIAPTSEPIRVADANIKTYRAKTEAGEIEVTISEGNCSVTSSDYKVLVNIKKGTDRNLTEFKGCGVYILDGRLNGTWVVSSLSNEEISVDNFREALPRIEINSIKKQFSGFGGCNQINGRIFTEDHLIRFIDIAQTRMLCAPPNQENEFLKALQRSIYFKVDGEQLILYNPDEETLRFIKTD